MNERDPTKSEVTPCLPYNSFDVELEYVNRLLGITLDMNQVKKCLTKMGLKLLAEKENNVFTVEVPPTRPDIMHPCDIGEDIGIAYGYNNIPKEFPPTNTVGKQQPLGKFTDLMRNEMSQAGYIEILTYSLLSIRENYLNMRK